MSIKPTNYLDVIKSKASTSVLNKPKFNLFDFSTTKPVVSTQTPRINFKQPISQKNTANFADIKAKVPVQTKPTQTSGFSLFPTANADNGEIDKMFLSKEKVKEIIDKRPK